MSGRMASSRKYGLGWSGPGYGQFDKGLNREILGFGKDCHFQYCPGMSGPGFVSFLQKGLNSEM